MFKLNLCLKKHVGWLSCFDDPDALLLGLTIAYSKIQLSLPSLLWAALKFQSPV